MILQALAKYCTDRIKVPEGYQKKDIPFIITISTQGHLVNLLDTRTTEGKIKRSRPCLVPREVKRSGSKAWEKANLLWDTPAYVTGHSSKDADHAEKKHRSFIKRFKETFPNPSLDTGIAAVSGFLSSKGFEELQAHSSWPDVLETDGYLTFQLEGDEGLVCERTDVIDLLSKSKPSKGKTIRGICLISGEDDEIVQLHNAIKGVRDAQSTGANIISFNLPAFESYGKIQSYNAPVGQKAEFAYITTLNEFLDKSSRQKIYVGDATTVFWTEKKHEIEDVLADIFGEPPKDNPDQDYKELIAMFKAPDTGAKPELNPNTKFYVLGLAPNAARITVRFWFAGSVREVAENIYQHFEDIEVVRPPSLPKHLSLSRLLKSTALLEDTKNIQPNLAGDFMKAILAGTPYPATLLSSAVRRIRAEHEITYQRASLIKAVLVRNSRYYNHNEKEVGMALDKNNINPGYLLGRLFAVLEKIQEEAAKPNKINSTIRDRFYASASSTPVVAFPHLMKLKNHHLSKIENYKGYYENLIGEIMGKSDSNKPFPANLSLDDQGRFAVGYYHQRYFKKQDDNK